VIDQDDPPAAKRQQIIHGAELVFTECGYEGASMSRIASEAGVSKGTLYNYFDSKSTLFAVFVEQMASMTLANIFQQASQEDDPVAALHEIALRMVEMIMAPDSLVLYRIVVSEARKFPYLATVFWRAGPCRAIDHMKTWIEGQVAAGRLDVPDPTFAAEQFLALCQTRIATQRRLQIVKETSSEEIELVVQGAVRLFLAGYGVDALASAQAKS
jgi:TetR/AcrR family transcriptional regulator, mexJK operon transcriptional repressor